MYLNQLYELSVKVPKPPALADVQLVKAIEKDFKINFPEDYIRYQTEYSNLIFGTLEIYRLHKNKRNADFTFMNEEAKKYCDLPEDLVAFAEDNGDYFCFKKDESGNVEKVVYWSHNGQTNENWKDFKSWVVECWFKEYQ